MSVNDLCGIAALNDMSVLSSVCNRQYCYKTAVVNAVYKHQIIEKNCLD